MKQNMSMHNRQRRWQSLGAMVGVAGLLLSAFLTNATNATDWTTYRGDIARSGVTSEGLNHALSLQWTYRPLQAPKPAWPAPSEELPRMHSDNAYHVAISQGPRVLRLLGGRTKCWPWMPRRATCGGRFLPRAPCVSPRPSVQAESTSDRMMDTSIAWTPRTAD